MATVRTAGASSSPPNNAAAPTASPAPAMAAAGRSRAAPERRGRAGADVGCVAVDASSAPSRSVQRRRRRERRDAAGEQRPGSARDERGGAARPVARPLGQAPLEHVVEPRRAARGAGSRSAATGSLVWAKSWAACVGTREHDTAGQALERERGERVAVRGGGRGPTADDLRGEVGERAEQLAGHGDAGVVAELGQAEVGEVGVVAVADEDVARLDVAVHEACRRGRRRARRRSGRGAPSARSPVSAPPAISAASVGPRTPASRGRPHVVTRRPRSTVTTCGCSSDACDCPSRRKRSAKRASAAESGVEQLERDLAIELDSSVAR